MSLAGRIADTLSLDGPARAAFEALYERQPATAAQVAERAGLKPSQAEAALSRLRQRGILQGDAYLWLDLAAALRQAMARPAAIHTDTDITGLFPAHVNEVTA